MQYVEPRKLYEVSFGRERQVLLRRLNLRRCEAPAIVPKVAPKQKDQTPPKGALTSLLGLGRQEPAAPPEPAQPAEWTSVWSRNNTDITKGVALTQEQLDVIDVVNASAMDRSDERERKERERVRRVVVEEFAQAGVYDETVIDEAIEAHLTKEADEEVRKRRRSTSSSSVSSSSSRSSRGSDASVSSLHRDAMFQL